MSRFFLSRLSSRSSLINAVGYCLLTGLLAVLVGVGFDHSASSQENQIPVTTVSAASFETGTLAPESIVSAYGVALATTTQIANASPLPTSLAGTSVKVKDSRGTERLAPLFFVSPGQINYQIPPGTAVGTATVTVTSGDNKTSIGSAQIANAAPSLFTANATGQGVPAATLFRLKADGAQSFEPATRFDSAAGRFVPLPIDLGAEGDQVFLLLFGTGFKFNGGLANVKVRIGGVDAEVSYADAAPGFTGLDQANVRLPRRLIGSGRVTLSLSVNGFSASNLVELEIAGAPSVTPPQINGYSAGTVLAGQLLTITGAGFSPNAADNLVRLGGLEARVVSASATQLTIRIPFGGASDVVSVRTPQGEGRGANPLLMRTSISGVVEDTRRQPLAGVKVRVSGTGIEFTTGAEGSFLLPDVPPASAQFVEFDGGTVPGTLPYPKVVLKMRVQANRDNLVDSPVALQQVTGPGAQVGGSSLTANPPTLAAATSRQILQQTSGQTLRIGEVAFEIPAGAGISLPNGARQGIVNLTVVENSRAPVKLPAGFFSQTIPQITPFGAVLLGGGKLTLPNTEAYPPGTLVKLFRLDQTLNSSSLGQFIEAGSATVTADGQRIETAANAITEITQYFVALARQTTTVTGRVVDSDGTTPIRQAIVRCRGQETVTDGNGGFVLRNVEANSGDKLSVEAVFVRASARVDRVQRINVDAIAGGLTEVKPDLALPGEGSNRAPVLLAPAALRINEAETREVNFVAYDPDPAQTIQLTLSGANFATLINRGNNVYGLRLQTRANDGGRYTLRLTGTDSLNQDTTLNIALDVNHSPIANPQSVVTDEDSPKTLTLTGSDLDGDPLSFAIVNNPLNGRLTGTLPNLTYTPDSRYTGTDSFTFKANDGATDSAPATVTIAINPINRPPALTVPLAQTANEGQELSFTVSASDPNQGQSLTFTATNLPGGANFTSTSNTTARFVWTPSFTQAGSYNVTFRVADNGVPALSDTKTVTITVNDVNRAPMLIVPGAQTINSGQLLIFAISATDIDPGQTLVFSTMDLPTGATFDPINREFSWKPIFLQTGTHEVVFKVTDNGLPPVSDTKTVEINVVGQWTPTASLDGGEIGGLAAIGTTLFAGGAGGVFRSADLGQNWTSANGNSSDLVNSRVTELFVNGNMLFAGTNVGIFRSTNQGQSWGRFDAGLPRGDVYAFAAIGNTLFTGIFGGGVFRSTDQGQSWVPTNTGLPPNPPLFSLGVSGTTLFAGTCLMCGGPGGGGFYLSTDLGQSWTPITGLPLTIGYDFAVLGSIIFAATGQGVFISTNNGQSWTLALAGLSEALAVNGSTIYATGYGKVFVSNNQGQSWTSISSGIPSNQFNELITLGSNIVAGNRGDGVFLLPSQGQSWTRANNGLSLQNVYGVAVSDTNLFAATDGGVFASSNNGQSWRLSNSGLFDVRLRALASISMNTFIGGVNGVYRSTDQGRNWIEANTGLAANNRDVRSLAATSTTLLMGTCGCSGGGIFLSNNLGQSWMSAGLSNLDVSAIAVGETAFFAGTKGSGVFRSTNRGQSWVQINTGLTELNINVLLVDGTNLLAGTYNGVFLSADNGESWVAINAGITDRFITALALSDTTIVAGTDSGGIFISLNNGQNWTPANGNLTNLQVRSLTLSGTKLFAGFSGGGVFIGQ